MLYIHISETKALNKLHNFNTHLETYGMRILENYEEIESYI